MALDWVFNCRSKPAARVEAWGRRFGIVDFELLGDYFFREINGLYDRMEDAINTEPASVRNEKTKIVARDFMREFDEESGAATSLIVLGRKVHQMRTLARLGPTTERSGRDRKMTSEVAWQVDALAKIYSKSPEETSIPGIVGRAAVVAGGQAGISFILSFPTRLAGCRRLH